MRLAATALLMVALAFVVIGVAPTRGAETERGVSRGSSSEESGFSSGATPSASGNTAASPRSVSACYLRGAA